MEKEKEQRCLERRHKRNPCYRCGEGGTSQGHTAENTPLLLDMWNNMYDFQHFLTSAVVTTRTGVPAAVELAVPRENPDYNKPPLIPNPTDSAAKHI